MTSKIEEERTGEAADDARGIAARSSWMTTAPKLVVFAASLTLIGAAIHRLTATQATALSKDLDAFDRTTLFYVLSAVALLFLDRLEAFKAGDYEIKFRALEAKAERIEKKATEAKEIGVRAERAAIGPGKGPARAEAVQHRSSETRVAADVYPKPISDRFDQQKNRFGGEPVRNGRRLAASVRRLDDSEDWFEVRMWVEALPGAPALSGAIQFFLHESFRRDDVMVNVGSNGRAELQVVAYGAFTIGALADNGGTPLELDLADPALVPSAPRTFRER